MVTIAHLADLHIDERDPHRSLAEQAESLAWIGADARTNSAEAILVAGDVYHRESTPSERAVAVRVFSAWAGVAPVVVVRGNHDRALDLSILSRIKSTHPITVHESAAVMSGSKLAIACIPWPSKARFVAALGIHQGLEARVALSDALRSLLAGLRVELSRCDVPRILLAHVELGGARLDSGQPVAGRCDVPISDGDLLDLGIDYGALGHIHTHQVIGDRLCYSGSVWQTTFGSDGPCGYCLVDVERGKAPVIEHVAVPGRILSDVDAEWRDGSLVDAGGGPSLGSPGYDWIDKAVRLSYRVAEHEAPSAAREASRLRDLWIEAGAHSVKIDPRVDVVSRVRSEEIRTARTTADRIEAFWASRGGRPEHADRVLARLAEIEQ